MRTTEAKNTTTKAAHDFQKGYEPYESEIGKTGPGPQGLQPKTSHQPPAEQIEHVYSDEESE